MRWQQPPNATVHTYLHNNQLRPLPMYGTHFTKEMVSCLTTRWTHSQVEWALPGLFHLEGNQVLLPPQWAGHIPRWNGLYQACSIVHNQAMKSQSHPIQGFFPRWDRWSSGGSAFDFADSTPVGNRLRGTNKVMI